MAIFSIRFMSALFVLASTLSSASAWTVPCYSPSRFAHARIRSTTSLNAAVGIFFGTSTGNTEECADKIYEAFGKDVSVAEPMNVDMLKPGELAEVFGSHDALIVGAPTWHTGADTERSGTSWDDLYSDTLPDLTSALKGKKVAVFGLGDQMSYSEYFVDAAGELYDTFETLECDMVKYAHTSQDGYDHEASRAIRDDKFCGLMLDEDNQYDLSDDRVKAWVGELVKGGFVSA